MSGCSCASLADQNEDQFHYIWMALSFKFFDMGVLSTKRYASGQPFPRQCFPIEVTALDGYQPVLDERGSSKMPVNPS